MLMFNTIIWTFGTDQHRVKVQLLIEIPDVLKCSKPSGATAWLVSLISLIVYIT